MTATARPSESGTEAQATGVGAASVAAGRTRTSADAKGFVAVSTMSILEPVGTGTSRLTASDRGSAPR